MNTKKKIAQTLRKADPEAIERVVAQAAAKEEVYAKLRSRMAENNDGHSVEYGVEQYRRISITRIASIAASAVLIAGAALGAVHLMKNAEPPIEVPYTSVVEETTTDEGASAETTATATEPETDAVYTTEAVVIPDEITPEFLYDQCVNAKKHYTRLSGHVSFVQYPRGMHLEKSVEDITYSYDRAKGILYSRSELTTPEADAKPIISDSYVCGDHMVRMICNSDESKNYYVYNYAEDGEESGTVRNKVDNDFLHFDPESYSHEFIKDVSPWTITGVRTDGDRMVASVTFSYTSMLDAQETHYHQNLDIDVQTGLLIDGDLYDDNYEGEENYLVSHFELDHLRLDDDAENPPELQMVKDEIAKEGFLNEFQKADYSDLDFLDE